MLIVRFPLGNGSAVLAEGQRENIDPASHGTPGLLYFTGYTQAISFSSFLARFISSAMPSRTSRPWYSTS